jgi:hypothetical protein
LTIREPASVVARGRVGLIYWWRHGFWPELAEPRKFTEWVQWRKLHDRDPARSMMTDKSRSKRRAAALLGSQAVVPSLWEGADLPADAPWPMPFVVKANHGCGQWIVVRGPADYPRARALSRKWLKRHYGAWLDEWHYRGARRGLIVEPYIGSGDILPVDYKIFVFAGRAEMVQLHEDRGGAHRWHQYDRDWQPVSRNAELCGAPASLSAMLSAAERLAGDEDFVRVDFYEVDGRPVFGEFCLYPGSGLDRFDPVSTDDWLGARWTAARDHARSGGPELKAAA